MRVTKNAAPGVNKVERDSARSAASFPFYG